MFQSCLETRLYHTSPHFVLQINREEPHHTTGVVAAGSQLTPTGPYLWRPALKRRIYSLGKQTQRRSSRSLPLGPGIGDPIPACNKNPGQDSCTEQYISPLRSSGHYHQTCCGVAPQIY